MSVWVWRAPPGLSDVGWPPRAPPACPWVLMVLLLSGRSPTAPEGAQLPLCPDNLHRLAEWLSPCSTSLALVTPEFCADPAPGQSVTCPCMEENGCLVSSPKCFKFSVRRKQALIITSSLLRSRQNKLLLSCNCESPLWMVAKGRWGDDVIPNSFRFPICQGGKSRLYCQAKLTDHLFRKVSQGQWAQIWGWAAKKVEGRWTLGEKTDLELSHEVLGIQQQSLPV